MKRIVEKDWKEIIKMNKDEYITKLEDLFTDLLNELESLSDDYGFSIQDGDCNYNYIKNEFELLKEKGEGNEKENR